MPVYLPHLEPWLNTWPLLLLAALVAIVLSRCGRSKPERRAWLLPLFALALLGLITGTMAGFSRSPVMDAVLPAVLSLVGALLVYLLGRDAGERLLVSLGVIALTFCLWVGANWGAILRAARDDYVASVAYQRGLALDEIEIREFRESLGLPPTPSQVDKAKGDKEK